MRLVVEQRDAVPQHVLDHERALADAELGLRADPEERALVGEPVAVVDPQRLQRRPRLPGPRHVLPRVLTDGARGHRSAVLHPAGDADGVAHALDPVSFERREPRVHDRHRHPQRHPGAARPAARRGHPGVAEPLQDEALGPDRARLDRARRRRDRARPGGRGRPHVVRAAARAAGRGARARLGDARRQAGLRAARRRRVRRRAHRRRLADGRSRRGLPHGALAASPSAACSPAWCRRRR